LRPLVKLAGQIAGAVLVFANGVRIETVAQIDLPIWVSFGLTVFWLLLSTNALNLIDGLDGLCAGMGLLATLTLFGAAFMEGNLPLAYVMLPLVGALLGFLCYNFNPATVFLGDAGALSIGFLLGCCGMVWTQKTATLLGLAIPLLGLIVPLTDVSLSVVRRFLRNKPIFSADRGHIHHRLLDRGLSPRRAVLVLYFAAGCSTLFALALITPRFAPYRGVIFLLILAAAAFGVRQLKYNEFIAAGAVLFGGAFQRSVGATLEMDRLAQALAATTTEQGWWNVLAQLARDQHWRKLEWRREGQALHGYRKTDESDTLWDFEIHLAPGESLSLAGGATPGGFLPLNLHRLAEVVRDSYVRQFHAAAAEHA
jgi:UDP-GlcNAc:undecaprenyl-phosphate/decaprenyl-phosphate GlcNAc-1-phosphate transferase